MKIDDLIKSYKAKKGEIQKRIEEFKSILNRPDERIFAELAFCLCTPQSRATICWNAIVSLMDNNLLFEGGKEQIKPFLNPVRFADNKAKYIIEARKFFTENGKLKIKEKIKSFDNAYKLREWLVENIKGIGMKEAGHFIRNIGFDYKNQLAILDRHVLKNLKELEIIKEIPKIMNKKKYLEIENKMRTFSEKIGIPLYELDLLFWSKETGIVFK